MRHSDERFLGVLAGLVFLYILLSPVFIIGGWVRIKETQAKLDKAIENQENLIRLFEEAHKRKQGATRDIDSH